MSSGPSIFTKILVGLDGTEHGMDALALAQDLLAPDGEILACCIHRYRGLSAWLDPTAPRIDEQRAQETLDAAARQQTTGTTITPMVLPGGSAAATLQRLAASQGAELIVLGSSHRGRLGEVFPGSITLQVLHEARCSVAIAPAGYRNQPRPGHPRRLAVGYDLREPVTGALTAAVKLCERTGARLQVIAVADGAAIASSARLPTPHGKTVDPRLRGAQSALDAALETVPGSVSASGEVLEGGPSELLLREGGRFELLVLGSHGRGWLKRFFQGSVAEEVVRGPTCPVVVVAPNT